MTDEKNDDLEKKVADDKKLSKKEKDEILNKNAIEINPTINEAPDKTVVLGWGRMNPITVGHEKLVNKIKEVARANSATPLIYITHSQDAKKNPLDYDTKVSLAKKAFGNKVIQKSKSKTIMQVMGELQAGYSKVILVVGSDRVTEFDRLLKRYNGKDYTFDNIEVVTAGERDPDAEGVEGMSASKMRAAAASGKFDQFKSGLPRKLKRDAQDIYDLVRGGMKIAEMMELDEGVMNLQQRRQRALTMRKYAGKIATAKKRMAKKKAPIAKLKQRARKAAIKILRSKVAGKTKGANYATLNPQEKMKIDTLVAKKSAVVDKIAKRMLPQIKKDELTRLSKLSQANESFDLQEGKMKEFDSYVKSGKDAKWISKKMGLDLKTVKDIIAYLSESVDLNAEFEALYEASCDTHTEEKPKKRRFHQMYSKKNGKLLLDRRFKAFRHLPKDDGTEAMLKAQRTCEDFETDKSLISFIEQVTNDISDSVNLAEDKRQSALQEKAEKSGVTLEILEQVYQRGLESYQESETVTAEQWAFARVNSFISGGKNTIEEDADLYEARKKQNSSARDRLLKGLKKHGYDADKIIKRAKDSKKEGLEWGTDQAVKSQKKDTPGQSIDEAFEDMFEAKQDSDIKDKEGTQPAKYYTGLAKSTKSKRDAHFKKGAKMDDDNPAAYKPAPGDAEAETKPSKHTKKFKDMYGESVQLDEDATKSLKDKAEKSGMPLGILKKVYDRGVAAWRTGHRPGTNPQQWGLARVNSFVTKSSGTWGKADKDLADKVRGTKKEETDPCWDSHKQVGMKKKGGKMVPNCVPKEEVNLDEAFELFSEKVDLQAGINDPGIFKAVFLAGGPGSGKSFIVGKTALTTLGLKLINSDDAFEIQLKKVGLDTTPEDIFSPAGQAVRGKAKALTKLRQKLALNGRLGLVVDGTGKDFDKIKKQSDELKRIGYETGMIFVNTDLDTALARNRARKRTLPDEDVTKMWKAVQNNIGKFQAYYGEKFIVVDNSEGADYNTNVMNAYRKMSKWIKTPAKTPISKKWIAMQKTKRGITK